MAYKVFSNGDALTGSELNTYLMNQSVMVFASTTARDAALTAPTEGMVVWLQDANKYVYYTGSAWADLITPASSGNAIINGAFDIWQRGTSFTNFNGSFLADRWQMNVGGGIPTGTISQQTFTPGTAPVAGYEGQFFMRTNYTALNSATVIELSNKIEDVRTFAGQTVTLSFWAKADASRTMTAFVRQGFGTGGSSSVDTTSLSASLTTSWTRFTHTVAIASITGKTIGTGSSLDVRFDLPITAGSTVDIWGVQLEAGSVATPFKRNAPSIQAELAACQRFGFTRTGTAYETIGTGIGLSSTLVRMIVQPPVPMRTYPTSVEWSTLRLENPITGATIAVTNVTISWGGSGNLVSVDVATAGSLTAGTQYTLQCNNSATGYFRLNVEL